MCPPSSDPIRPVGPVAGGVYVTGAQLPGTVRRRDRREEEPGRQRQRRGEGDVEQPSAAPVEDPAARAGTYDDHGRTAPRDDDEGPSHPHVNATA